jgi:hypothetical protein
VKAAAIAIAVLVVLALAAGRKYAAVRNDLVRQRRDMSEAWVPVDALLEERATAVSGLVDGVKDAVHDQPEIQRDLQDASAALLNGHSPEEKIQANARLNGALAKLLLLSETAAGALQRPDSAVPRQCGGVDLGIHAQRRLFQDRTGRARPGQSAILNSKRLPY